MRKLYVLLLLAMSLACSNSTETKDPLDLSMLDFSDVDFGFTNEKTISIKLDMSNPKAIQKVCRQILVESKELLDNTPQSYLSFTLSKHPNKGLLRIRNIAKSEFISTAKSSRDDISFTCPEKNPTCIQADEKLADALHRMIDNATDTKCIHLKVFKATLKVHYCTVRC